MIPRINIEDVQKVFFINKQFENLLQKGPLKTFDELTLKFLDHFSKYLLKDKLARNYPDLVSLGFFCRKGNISKLLKEFESNNNFRIGRGLSFHVSPSNVPINFAYSLVFSLLAGNTNIIRLPSKNFEQISIIVNIFNDLAKVQEFRFVLERICLIRYSRDLQEINKELSRVCDLRVIWGGDNTINKIRESSIGPRSIDITFADRYSLAMINSKEYVASASKKSIAEAFFNDTYLVDQNACTSPHIIIWLGDTYINHKARSQFWQILEKYIEDKYVLESSQVMDKFVSMISQSTSLEGYKMVSANTNIISRSEIANLTSGIENLKSSSGLFLEYQTNDMYDIGKIINQKYQTLSYFGVSKSEIFDLLEVLKPRGIDRIVPMGQTLNFSNKWDGYDLISSMSRIIEII